MFLCREIKLNEQVSSVWSLGVREFSPTISNRNKCLRGIDLMSSSRVDTHFPRILTKRKCRKSSRHPDSKATCDGEFMARLWTDNEYLVISNLLLLC